MFYAAIRKYSIIPRCMEEAMRRIQGDFLPIISQTPDSLQYYALRVGNHEIITIRVFYALPEALELNPPLTLEWVERNIAQFVQGVPEVTVGQVVAGMIRPERNEEPLAHRSIGSLSTGEFASF